LLWIWFNKKSSGRSTDGQGTTTLDGISALDAWLSLLVSALPLDHISESQWGGEVDEAQTMPNTLAVTESDRCQIYNPIQQFMQRLALSKCAPQRHIHPNEWMTRSDRWVTTISGTLFSPALCSTLRHPGPVISERRKNDSQRVI